MRAKNIKDILLGAFSENGVGSAKRIVGSFMILCVMFCTIWSCIKFGMIESVKSVIETEIITAGTLLGITSVTNIWRKKLPQPEEEEKKENEKED
jgi:hypothetical protein